MKLPVIYNNNYQIQDAEGRVICDFFRHWDTPSRDEDGRKVAELINGVVDNSVGVVDKPESVDEVVKADVPKEVVKTNGHRNKSLEARKAQAEKMRAYWAKRREEKSKV